DIAEYDTATGKRSIRVAHTQLIPPKGGKPLAVEDYRWDKDGNRLLVYTESRQVWRTNSRGDYWVLDRSAGTLKKLGGDAPASSLSFAKLSPDGTRVAYVRANNLYVEDLATGVIRAITSDGSDTLVNGGTDSLYPKIVNIPYPKAGTKNSAVRVGVIGVEGGAPRWMQVPGDPRDHYIF